MTFFSTISPSESFPSLQLRQQTKHSIVTSLKTILKPHPSYASTPTSHTLNSITRFHASHSTPQAFYTSPAAQLYFS
ncbi:hypothetical protein E2C01_026079 [Portunus trituberculatus]|uniref:Uncharacterized protein n=1 Tax=Portunus trituberculatus TaxID=210409 RepID=A0A5B7EET4_PORTR|nr:hypothetical protein [Portunus trituberculatus]